MSHRAWPDGDDAIAAELRRALDEAQQRIPDDVTLRRGWAAIDTRPSRRASRGAAVVVRGRHGEHRGARTRVRGVAVAARRADARARAGQAGRGRVERDSTSSETRRLTLEGGVEAELQRTSVMRIEGSDPRVEGGTVRFKVPRRRPGHPFVVRADRYHVVVIGTKFGVAVNGDRRVDVDVDEGVVEVWNNDVRLARLEPGQRVEQLARVRGGDGRRRANAGGEARRRRRQVDREVRAAA